MRKIFVMGILFCVVMGFAFPAAALEVDFSGEFRVEGVLNSSEGMLDSDSTSDFRKMRLRVKTDFKVTDNLSLTTRFDALEKILSSDDSAFNQNNADATRSDDDDDDDNIDFDRAYLSYISPIGFFQVGRMKGVVWGTSFCDDEIDTDRIKYVLPIPMGDGKLYIGAVAEKVTEVDKGVDQSDADNDKYYLGFTYKTKNYSTGLLTAFYNFKTFYDPGQAFAQQAFNTVYADDIEYTSMELPGAVGSYASSLTGYATAMAMDGGVPGANLMGFLAANPDFQAQNAVLGAPAALGGNVSDPMNVVATRGLTTEGAVFLLAPYFEGKFGDLGISAELDYAFGTTEYDNPGAKDRDLSAYAFFVEASYDIGAFTFQGGVAQSTGDADYTDDDIGSMGYVSPGLDWNKLFILHDDTHGMNNSLGNGVGNHVGYGFATASTAMCDGYQLFYAGVDYAVNDSLSLGLIAGISKADEVPDGMDYDDEQGIEYDLSLTWKITDNLEYTAIAAYLDGGDYWESRASGITDSDIDPDIYTLYHKISLVF